MQREIKFRAKRLDNGEWVYGYPIKNEFDDKWYIFPPQGLTGTTGAEVDPDSIGQYTELTDRNGKDIYEGDIVQWQWEAGHLRSKPMEVVAKFGAFSYMYCDDFHSFVGNTNFTFCELGTDKRVEIVGNIHDNPSLLKGGDQ